MHVKTKVHPHPWAQLLLREPMLQSDDRLRPTTPPFHLAQAPAHRTDSHRGITHKFCHKATNKKAKWHPHVQYCIRLLVSPGAINQTHKHACLYTRFERLSGFLLYRSATSVAVPVKSGVGIVLRLALLLLLLLLLLVVLRRGITLC